MQLAVKQESFRIEVLLSRLQTECFNLCCTNLKTNELSMDEVRCTDRCVWRYLETNSIIASTIGRGESGGGRLKL
ncbi:Tim10-like [Trypanosoma melophagium]|uniref:Tim10-like n=1 Tax=Trypanosoma melophagium TaxID=715481 RepID=UPI00351A2ED9|nr:Tim10-like [Trypanosoma melophagium]